MVAGPRASHFVQVVAGKLKDEQYQQAVLDCMQFAGQGSQVADMSEWAEGAVKLGSAVQKVAEKAEQQQAEQKLLPGFGGGGGWLASKESGAAEKPTALPGFGSTDWLLDSPDASAGASAAGFSAVGEAWNESEGGTGNLGARAGEGGNSSVSTGGSSGSGSGRREENDDATVTDQIECSLTMPSGGHWLVWVTVAGANIAGSPFLFHLSPPPISDPAAAAADPDARRAALQQKQAEARRRKMQAKRMARRQLNEEKQRDEEEARRRRQQRQTVTAQRAAEALRRHREAEAAAEAEREAHEERMGMRNKARQGGGYNLEYLAALNQGETLFQSGR
jgi:hypothetical protein